MNAQSDTHLHGKVGALVTGDRPEIKISMHCPGPDACPHTQQKVPHSLYSEAEFHRLSGCRADAREQELLEAFRQRHRLKWRGSKSIEKMWRHRTLEYDRRADDLRLTPNLFFHGLGWLHFGLSALAWILHKESE